MCLNLRKLVGKADVVSLFCQLVGNMWAQDWTNILSLVQPYDLPSVDVTAEMKRQVCVQLKSQSETLHVKAIFLWILCNHTMCNGQFFE